MKNKSVKNIRNVFAIHAKSRKSGGPMKHRLEPKAGSKNDQPELLEQVEEKEAEDESEDSDPEEGSS